MKTISRNYEQKSETKKYAFSEAMLADSGRIVIHNYDHQGNSEMLMLNNNETSAVLRLVERLFEDSRTLTQEPEENEHD